MHLQFSSVQFSRSVQLFETPWIAARQASLSITNSQSSPKLMSIESVIPSSHLTLCYPCLLLPPIPPSIRVFSNESTLHMRWPKYWSFSFSIGSPSKEHPGLISFRMDWLDLLASYMRHFKIYTLQYSRAVHIFLSMWERKMSGRMGCYVERCWCQETWALMLILCRILWKSLTLSGPASWSQGPNPYLQCLLWIWQSNSGSFGLIATVTKMPYTLG